MLTPFPTGLGVGNGPWLRRSGYHQREERIEAHIFVSFLAYCVHVTFKHQLKMHAPGLTVHQALEKFAAIQLLDVHFPTTDGRELIFIRYTEPEPDQQLLLGSVGPCRRYPHRVSRLLQK